jgi:hypothetical protein
MNRTWESAGTQNILVAGDEIDREKGAWDLPEDHLEFYVDFFDNYIFPNITKEFAQSTFPVKIYMINNLREEPRNIGKDKENGENNDKAGTGVAPNKNLHIGTFDNWVISFPEDVAKGTETGADTEYMLKQQRCIFMTNVIKNSIQKGEIKAPIEFWSDYSMNKDAQCIDGKHDSCDKVYVPTDTVPNLSEEKIREFKEGEKGLYTLGYVDVLEEKFGTGNTTRIKKQIYNKTRGWNHPDYWTSKINPTCDLFEAFIMNALWFTPEEFHKYDMVAYTMFDGNEYGVPAEMLDDANFYVIDIDGVKTLRQRYNGKKLCVIYLDLPTDEAIERMRKRGDSEEKISVRLANDAVKFADVDGLAPDYVIDAGRSYEEVTASFEEVLRKIGVIK